MTKKTLMQLARLALTPVILIFLGITLMLNPDAAPVFVSKLLGWLMLIIGILLALGSKDAPVSLIAKLLPSLLCFFAGAWVLKNPLAVLATVTKLAGLLILINAIGDISRAKQFHSRMTWAIISAVVGGVFLLMPLTASRLVLKLCGLAVLLIGCLILWVRIRRGDRLNPPDGHNNVIDAL